MKPHRQCATLIISTEQNFPPNYPTKKGKTLKCYRLNYHKETSPNRQRTANNRHGMHRNEVCYVIEHVYETLSIITFQQRNQKDLSNEERKNVDALLSRSLQRSFRQFTPNNRMHRNEMCYILEHVYETLSINFSNQRLVDTFPQLIREALKGLTHRLRFN